MKFAIRKINECKLKRKPSVKLPRERKRVNVEVLIDNGTVLYTLYAVQAMDILSSRNSGKGRRCCNACYKEVSRRSHVVKASFAVLTATYAMLGRPPKSLAEGTSYLRIVFASTDYCLTCSVAFSCASRLPCAPRIPSRVFCLSLRVHVHTYTYVCGSVCL